MNELPSLDAALLAELDAAASTPEDAARLRAHAERDPAAAAVLAALAATRAELADTPVPAPPPELVARWHDALAQLPPPDPVPVLPPGLQPLPAADPPPLPAPAAVPAHGRPATSPARVHPGPLRLGTQSKAPRRSRWLAAAATVAAAAVTVLVGPPAPIATEAPLALVSEQLSTAAAAGLTGHDLGPLADPAVLAGCLARASTPPTTPLGGRPVLLDGRPGILLAFAGERPGRLRLLVVTPDCASDRGSVLAHTTTGR